MAKLRSNAKALKSFARSLEAHAEKWEIVASGETWKPESEGEFIIGTITARNVIDTKYGEKSQVVITTQEGVSHSLFSGMADLKILNRIPLNSPVKVEYQGTKKVKGRAASKNVFIVRKPVNIQLEEDWTGGKYYDKLEDGDAGKGGRGKAKKSRNAKRKAR